MLVSIALRKSQPYNPQIKNKKRGRCYIPCTGSLWSLQLGLCKGRQDRGCPLPYTYMHVNHIHFHTGEDTHVHTDPPCPQDKLRVLLTVLFHMVLTVRTKASSEATVRSLLGTPTCPKETRARSWRLLNSAQSPPVVSGWGTQWEEPGRWNSSSASQQWLPKSFTGFRDINIQQLE